MSISKDEDRDDVQLEDQRIASHCSQQLITAAKDHRKNFFIACGFHKPHPPWYFPKEFLHRLPKDVWDIPLADEAVRGTPEGMPKPAYHGLMDIKIQVDHSDTAHREQQYIRRAYYASVAYTDYNIGKVLQTLQNTGRQDDTLVVVTSDHGWHLGEQGMWGKMTNYESSLRVPLIMKAPWLPKSKGRVTDTLAELVDLYPTLAEIAGLPQPAHHGEQVDGTSLLPVFLGDSDNVARYTKKHAVSQVAKPSLDKPDKLSVTMHRNETEIMGYSIRTHKYRYTVWYAFDRYNQVPNYHKELGRELYDHSSDAQDYSYTGNGGFDSRCEMVNLAQHPDGRIKDSHKTDMNNLHGLLVSEIKLKPIPNGREPYEPDEGWIVAMGVPATHNLEDMS